MTGGCVVVMSLVAATSLAVSEDGNFDSWGISCFLDARGVSVDSITRSEEISIVEGV